MNVLKQAPILMRALCVLAFSFPMLLSAQQAVPQILPIKAPESTVDEEQISEMLDSLVKIRFISRFDEENSAKTKKAKTTRRGAAKKKVDTAPAAETPESSNDEATSTEESAE